MATKQDRAIQSQIFQPTFSRAIPPANTVINEKSHSPKAPAAAPACRSLSGAICITLETEKRGAVTLYMTAYLWSVQPWNTDPAVSKNKIVHKYSSNCSPLRSVGRVRQADHGNEHGQTNSQSDGGVDEDVATAEPLDGENEEHRPDGKEGVHQGGEELGHELRQADLGKYDRAIVYREIDTWSFQSSH